MAKLLARLSSVLAVLVVVSSIHAGDRSDRLPSHSVKSHAAVDTAFRALTTLDTPARRVLYREMPADLQGRLWVRHFEDYLERQPELTAIQRSVIYEAIGLMAYRSDSAAFAESLEELRERAPTAFHRGDLAVVFGTLGPASANLSTPETDMALARLRSMYPPRLSLHIPECSCSSGSDYCSNVTNPDYICEPKGCSRTSFGCGFMWAYPCDGMCGDLW